MAILQENWSDVIKSSDVEVRSTGNNEAVLVFSPLDRGYGITLGNALRRVLLTSIRGFAVTNVKINGSFSEYESIDGIREDLYEIIMNIKSILFTKDTSAPSKLFIRVNKKGQVLARDIKIENGGEILNPDLVICNIEKSDVEFSADMLAEFGSGYVPAEANLSNDKELGNIKLDAIFNPVRNVAYKVENVRIGNKTDYDSLELKIKTNGALTPIDAVSLAAKILQTQFEQFIGFNVKDTVAKLKVIETSAVAGDINPSLLKRIDEIEMSVRSANCLKSENINFIGDLVQRSEQEMMAYANFGKKSLTELRETLKVLGLGFGMKIDNWDKILKDNIK